MSSDNVVMAHNRATMDKDVILNYSTFPNDRVIANIDPFTQFDIFFNCSMGHYYCRKRNYPNKSIKNRFPEFEVIIASCKEHTI